MRINAVFGLLGLVLAGCAGGVDNDPYPKPFDFPIHGIDVSKFQGDIDWNAVYNGNVQFAWIKATEGGDHLDSKFQENWEASRAAGLRRGAYHFVFWCRSAREQMAWFERNVPREPDALPPVLDVELTPGSKSCPRTLRREEVVAEIREMLTEMERFYGKRPVLYSTVDFYAGILSGGALSEYPIWVRSTKYFPTVRYGDRKWHFWQYQSDGRVPGIQAKVDRNAFYGSAVDWTTFLGSRQAVANATLPAGQW